MADVEQRFSLLLELGENTNAPGLKNKIVKYFQSRRAHGGDCDICYENGSRTALLHFRREEDRRNVLAREFHQINLNSGVLNVRVRLTTEEKQDAPFDELNETKIGQSVHLRNLHVSSAAVVPVINTPSSTDEHQPEVQVHKKTSGPQDEAADKELDSKSAVLGNIPETMNQEFLEMLVENIFQDLDPPSAFLNYKLEIIPDISSAVVSFQTGKESTDFVTRCSKNRNFTKQNLSVRPLEVTAQVLFEDLQSISEDHLRLYIEHEGEDVENVELHEVEQSAIITFKDPKAVQRIVSKKHYIEEEEIRVYPFYKSLGTALYGKDKLSLKLPVAISELVDNAVWRYLQAKPSAADTIRAHMAKHLCSVNLSLPTVSLRPVSSLLQRKDAKTIIRQWKENVKAAFAETLTQFKSIKLRAESEAWKESEEKIRRMLLDEDVVVVAEEASGFLSVAGLVADVSRLEPTLCEAVNKIVKRLQREKSSLTEVIKVSPSIFHMLCQDGLQEKLLGFYPELQMSSRRDSTDLMITGLSSEIMAASKVIFQEIFGLQRQNLEIDKFVLEWLKDGEQEELTDTVLASHGINAVLDINTHRVQLLAVSHKVLNDAEEHLGQLLISHYIDVEDRNVLLEPEWGQLVSQRENTNNEPHRIGVYTTDQQVVLSGHKDEVMRVSTEFVNFLKQNAHVEEKITIKPNTKIEYLKQHHSSSWFQQGTEGVVVSYKEDNICLSGSRVDVETLKPMVEDLISSVIFESFKVSKPGAKKNFFDQQAMYVSSLLSETGCLVQLVDETGSRPDNLTHNQILTPMYQLHTPDGVEIAVCKADMCSYSIHAVVNPYNKDLKHNGSLAKALLKAAGPQLQNEIDKIISSNGKLKTGDCVLTEAGGQLCCKNIIHVVAPRFDPTKSNKSKAQLKRAIKGSLELAEKHGCMSVALPAVGRTLGFPLKLCVDTIVRAVKEHGDEKNDDCPLNKIHFVDTDVSVVKDMEEAVRQIYGRHNVSHSPPTKGTKAPQGKPAGSDPNCLGQAVTKEGVDITVMKGNIEEATTEVILNTVFEDLVLKKGAVSSSILGVAGPKLQEVVNAENASGTIGEIVVTEGCKLKCKNVFHVVTPHWDKGKGTAEKTLIGIFKDCLDKAEDGGWSSISFPAIGTGKLGFPIDLAASLMLDEILVFSMKKQPKHLKKVVIILYPTDTLTIQVFSHEFKKRFSTDSGAPLATTSTLGFFSKIASSSGLHETKMGNVSIQLVTGDITKETTDIIINSSNDKFSLKSGVSKAIMDAAGQDIEDECQNFGSQPNPGIILTQPGNLSCKKVLHLIGQTDPFKISKVVKDALQMCVTNSYTSVSLPAIGTGQGNVKPRQVADAILDAIIDVLSRNPSSSLKTIRVVIFQPPMLKEFYNSMKQREALDPKIKVESWFAMVNSKIKDLFYGVSKTHLNEGDFVIEPLKVDPACFNICGESEERVALAKQSINKLISKEQNKCYISDNAILYLSDADHQRIVDIQKNIGVSIRTECINGKASVSIEGLSKDVLKANTEIHNMLMEARDKEDHKKKIELATSLVDWQYQQQGLQFQSFNETSNYVLEFALKNNIPTSKVTIQGRDFTVQMPDGPAIDGQGVSMEIKRIEKDEDMPSYWDTMPASTSCLAVNLKAGTAEYTEVQNLFKATCGETINKIERIQNPALWKSLQIKKRDMEQRNGHPNNEKQLFHGTCHDTVQQINELGFNRSFAGKNAANYGNGTYFAVSAEYSARDTYSKPNTTDDKCMYLCRVLTGDYTTGKQNMVTPPAKSAVSIQKYDSVVDNMANPQMFIIFHDSQAYPEYLITFKRH